jgi:hypothetical protein
MRLLKTSFSGTAAAPETATGASDSVTYNLGLEAPPGFEPGMEVLQI